MTDERDLLLEALEIIAGKTRIIAQREHLQAIWLATDQEIAAAQERLKANG